MALKKNKLLLIPVLIAILFLSGCDESDKIDYGTPETMLMNTVTNSKTDELLDNFEYLFMDIKSDSAAIEAQSFDDIVTIAVLEHDGTMNEWWIYDAKRSAVFQAINPRRRELLSAYKDVCDISATDARALIDTLKNDNSHKWADTYPGRNIGTGDYSWSISIEYKNGVIEKHRGKGSTGKTPRGFIEFKNKLYNLKYGRNPLFSEDAGK